MENINQIPSFKLHGRLLLISENNNYSNYHLLDYINKFGSSKPT